MRSSLQGPHVSGRVRELISLVNNTQVVYPTAADNYFALKTE
jgi:hypothetical protein